MKKRYFGCIALSLIFVMLIFTVSCGVRINGREYEIYKSSQSDKKNNSIIGSIGTESANHQEIERDKTDTQELKVGISAGNIDIRKTGGSKIIVNADKKVRGVSSENKKTILENMIVSLEQNGQIVDVAVRTKDGENFWDWQKENYRTYQVTINFTIKVPDNVKVLNLSTGAGNIEVEGMAEKLKASTGAGNIDLRDIKAEFDVSTGAGNIDIDNSSAKGGCKLNTGAGNIDFEGNVNDLSEIEASTGMGNVDFQIPEETKMSLDASTGVGILEGSFIRTNSKDKFHFTGDINGGGPSVKLSTGVGNVRIDKD